MISYHIRLTQPLKVCWLNAAVHLGTGTPPGFSRWVWGTWSDGLVMNMARKCIFQVDFCL